MFETFEPKECKHRDGGPFPSHACTGVRPNRLARPDGLVAAARSDHHVAVLLEDDVGAVVEVEH